MIFESFVQRRFFAHTLHAYMVPTSLTFNLGIPHFEEDVAHLQQIYEHGIFEDYVQEENMVVRIAKQVRESPLWLSFTEL